MHPLASFYVRQADKVSEKSADLRERNGGGIHHEKQLFPASAVGFNALDNYHAGC